MGEREMERRGEEGRGEGLDKESREGEGGEGERERVEGGIKERGEM